MEMIIIQEPNQSRLNMQLIPEKSPVFALGFKNFPMYQFGVQIEELKRIAATPEMPEIK